MFRIVQDKCIEVLYMYIQSTEMKESSASSYKNMEIGNKRIITNYTQMNGFPFHNLYHICARDVKSSHLHTHINGSFWKCDVLWLKRGG